jgi:hypothetical protein
MSDEVTHRLSEIQSRVREELFLMDAVIVLRGTSEDILTVVTEGFRRIRALSDEALQGLPQSD